LAKLGAAAAARQRLGARRGAADRQARARFAVTGISNGLSTLTLFAAVRNGPITLVAPLVAIYPLVTVILSAIMLRHIAITARVVLGTVLTVAGVALVLAG
jgi:uncharacterized membrane protein